MTYQRQTIFFLYLCSTMEQEIVQAIKVLQRGGTLLYPTDTIWGIGCDARCAGAVERLYAIKERDRTKSMLVLVESWPALEAMVSDDRPTTFILPKSMWYPVLGGSIADNLVADDGSLGVRVPRHRFCQQLLHRLGAPLVSTSANLSGHPSPQCYEDIEEELKRRVDHCVAPLAAFDSGRTQGSRIVKLNADGSHTVIRP